jgi:predicted nucleotidyltransferase
MKISKKMSIGEFAAFVASHLQSKGISTVLTGGAVVSIYTENKYMSYDADFISPEDHKIQ